MTTTTEIFTSDEIYMDRRKSMIKKFFGKEEVIFPAIEILDKYPLKDEMEGEDPLTIYLYGYSQLKNITVGDFLKMKDFINENIDILNLSLSKSPITDNPIVFISFSKDSKVFHYKFINNETLASALKESSEDIVKTDGLITGKINNLSKLYFNLKEALLNEDDLEKSDDIQDIFSKMFLFEQVQKDKYSIHFVIEEI